MAPPGVLPADLSAKALSEVLPPGDGELNQTAGASVAGRRVCQNWPTQSWYGKACRREEIWMHYCHVFTLSSVVFISGTKSKYESCDLM